MKTVRSGIVAIILAASMAVQAEARDQGINGLLVGAGGGALAGQAIGRDTEGTLIGAAVGGMVGYMVGNEMDKQDDRGYVSTQPAVFPPPPPPSDIVLASGGYGSRYYHRPFCQNVVTFECRYGRCRDVIKTVCFERDRWNYRHWDDRRHWRGNDRHWHNKHWRDKHWRDHRWDGHDRRDRHRHHRRW